MQELFRLQLPSRDLRNSYRSLIAEFSAGGEQLIPFPLTFPFDDFDAFLARLEDGAKGVGLADGFVPNSTFWLVRNVNEIVGVSNLRHRLNPVLSRVGGNIGYGVRPAARRLGFGSEMLRQTLLQARMIHLPSVLITCGKQNLGSVGVILRNGGVLESEEFIAERGEVVQRYRIEFGVAGAA